MLSKHILFILFLKDETYIDFIISLFNESHIFLIYFIIIINFNHFFKSISLGNTNI